MKKSHIALLVIAAVVILSSCKAREKCPAYGNKTYKAAQKHS